MAFPIIFSFFVLVMFHREQQNQTTQNTFGYFFRERLSKHLFSPATKPWIDHQAWLLPMYQFHHITSKLSIFLLFVGISSLHYYIQVPFSCHMIIIYSTFSPSQRVNFSSFWQAMVTTVQVWLQQWQIIHIVGLE